MERIAEPKSACRNPAWIRAASPPNRGYRTKSSSISIRLKVRGSSQLSSAILGHGRVIRPQQAGEGQGRNLNLSYRQRLTAAALSSDRGRKLF